MAEQTTINRKNALPETCITGSKTDEPCPRLAVKLWGQSALCEEHYREAVLQERVDDCRSSLALLEDMIYEARGHHANVLVDSLERVRAGIKKKPEDREGVLGCATELADGHRGRGSSLAGR